MLILKKIFLADCENIYKTTFNNKAMKALEITGKDDMLIYAFLNSDMTPPEGADNIRYIPINTYKIKNAVDMVLCTYLGMLAEEYKTGAEIYIISNDKGYILPAIHLREKGIYVKIINTEILKALENGKYAAKNDIPEVKDLTINTPKKAKKKDKDKPKKNGFDPKKFDKYTPNELSKLVKNNHFNSYRPASTGISKNQWKKCCNVFFNTIRSKQNISLSKSISAIKGVNAKDIDTIITALKKILPDQDHSQNLSQPTSIKGNPKKPPSAVLKNTKELKAYVVTGIYDKYIPKGVSLKVWHKSCAAYLNFPYQKKKASIEERIMMTKGVNEENLEAIMEALINVFGKIE